MTSQVVQSCQTCKFCRSATGPAKELQWFCAIRAPQAVPVPAQGGMQILPVMPPLPPTKWCGEWKAEDWQK
jgi:hypothetical protein